MAMTSGRLAGETAVEAKTKGDYSRQALSAYVGKLKACSLWPGLMAIQDVERAVESSPGFMEFYLRFACELAHLRCSVDGRPKRERLWKAIGSMRRRGFMRVARDLWSLRKAVL